MPVIDKSNTRETLRRAYSRFTDEDRKAMVDIWLSQDPRKSIRSRAKAIAVKLMRSYSTIGKELTKWRKTEDAKRANAAHMKEWESVLEYEQSKSVGNYA